MTIECPPNEVLCRYALGDLDDPASDDIERHLALCPACEDSLARFDSTEDSLMRHLPLAAAQAPQVASESACWLAQLRNGPLDAQRSGAELPPSAGTRLPAEFSAYELLGVLGSGGMGVVYRARHRQLNRPVALKVLSPRLMATSEARVRFEREIRILGGLHHPGIVMATDANRIDGAAYLVMELIDGVDLARMVRVGGPLSVAEACEAGRQIADALAAAHQAGTIHRDIKPSNVMLDRQGRIKLLDFGLAHLAEASTESLETSLGRLLGTLDYMAPEQADTARPLDARADLFGLGATLFYLLTGRPPHGDHSRGSLLKQLRAFAIEDPPRVRTLRADVPADLDDFIARLLSRDPAERPESAESVAATLSVWAGGNLAARVAEVRPGNAAADPAFDTGEIAQRSLSELLRTGFVALPDERANVAAPHPAPRPPRRWGPRKAAWLAAAAALGGAVLFGVTILLKTPDGELKIESEVDNVRVELVDDQDQTLPLQIHRGGNETTLRAGRYRIRLAGEHEDVVIAPDVITLKRGDKTVARITRLPAATKEPVSANNRPHPGQTSDDPFAGTRTNGPLYQGQSESEWQRIFALETSPTAKLDEAVALVTLAAELPPKERIQKILDVGAEIVRASFGEETSERRTFIDFSLADPFGPPDHAPRWQLKWTQDTRDGLYGAYSRFQNLVNHEVQNVPAEPLAVELSRVVRQGSSARGAFAASLLRGPARSVIRESPEASQAVWRTLDAPLEGLGWSAVSMLVRACYLEHASTEQINFTAAGINNFGAQLKRMHNSQILIRPVPQVGESLVSNPYAPTTQTAELMRADLLEIVKFEPKAGWPRTVRNTIAGLILDSIVWGRRSFYEVTGLDPSPIDRATQQMWAPYDPRHVAQQRHVARRFLDQWLLVANGYLEKNAGPPYTPAVRGVVESIRSALLVYSDGDDWPAKQTVALLTKQLRAYYTDNAAETTTQSVEDLLPASPGMLLTQIVRVTGEIPDFVKKGHPRPKSVGARFQRFEAAVRAGRGPFGVNDPSEELVPLVIVDPYAIIKLAVEPRPKDRPFDPQQVLRVAARDSSDMDPLPYLAVLTDLAGNNPAQDDRIGKLLRNWQPGTDMRNGLEHLFAGHLKAREQARRLLERMAAKAKSPALVDALHDLNAALLPSKP